MLKKKIWPNFSRIIAVFTQKIVTKPSKIWVWDPGSEIRDPRSGIRKNLFRIPDPGVKKAPDPGSRIQGSKRHRIPDPGVKKAPDPGSGSATLMDRYRPCL
jgi:hypothetical protein